MLPFDRHLREKTNNCPEAAAPDTIFEFTVDPASFEWTHWGSQIPTWEFSGSDIAKEFSSLLIPTIDSVRTEKNMELSISMDPPRPVLLVGSPGTAKTSIILQVLAKQDPSTTAMKKLSFSAATTPIIYQVRAHGARGGSSRCPSSSSLPPF